jgi:CRP-like cAMP-binding protein
MTQSAVNESADNLRLATGAHRLELTIFVRTLFGEMAGGVADEIASRMREVDFEKGQYVYRRGEASTYLYFIEEGNVVLEVDGEEPWKMGPMDGFGFQDAMQDRPHARDARAATDARVLVFSLEDWLDIIEDHSELGRSSLLRHAQSVRNMIGELVPDGGFPPPEPARSPRDPAHPPDLIERMVTLSETPVFERAGMQSLATMARVARAVHHQAGDVIVEPGKPLNRVYVVAAGSSELRREQPELVARFGPNSMVGGLSLFGLDRSDFTLTALEESLVFHISQDDWFELMDDHFELARSVFLRMGAERQAFMGAIAERKRARRRA